MEDSYNVHRRRKAAAAARKREKTPEPSSRQGIVEASDDEEEASRRARMERMVEDSEKLEMENRIRLETSTEQTNEPVLEEGKSVPVETRRGQEVGTGSGTRESDGGEEARREAKPQETNRESVNEDAKGQEALSRHKETADDNVKTLEPRKVERRLKKRSKERLEKQAGSTDSSDMEDRLERSPRRTKSPDGSKIRARKTVAKTVTRSSGDPEVPTGRKETIEKPPREKKQPGARPRNEETGNGERRHSRKCSNTDDTDDERRMKKSETFPRGSSTKEEQPIKRSATELKKQIIPLSNDSLIEDFAKAQREYLMRERSILDPDPTDVYQDANEEQSVRRRKTSLGHSESERERTMERARGETVERTMEKTAKRSWFSWIPILGRAKDEKRQDEKKADKEEKTEEKPSRKLVEVQEPEKVTLMDFFRALRDVVAEFKAFVDQNPRETRVIRLMRNRCASELLAMIIYCGLGAFVFRFTEGAFESFYKCGVKRVKRDFLDSLWNYSHNLREEDWKSMARRKLMEFEEQLHTAHEAGVHTYSGQRSWSFLNAVAYCLTVVTTIGYGHISPKTTTGRVITIIYAIFGIPMFLIVLADFGKLFTRGIKFLWAFVRRLYYTGSCRKVRRTGPVQEVMKGVQLVYDLATFRRPSQMNPEDIEEIQRQAAVQQAQQAVLNIDGNVPPDTPGTPAMSAFAIDDEFNLPISVAISILLGYIFIGATLYYMWEDWGFFESFYFVFISMSTIGFGDYVPKHPIYMMCSIIYLVFGLALTSMCINVVQVMLSDSFKQASQKIGATIGFEVVEDDGTVKPSAPPLVEVADVHVSVKESESSERIAPRAKQEDVDL